MLRAVDYKFYIVIYQRISIYLVYQTMGIHTSKFFNLDDINEYIELKRQVINADNRLAELERNYTNVTVRVIQNQEVSDQNKEDILAINLMEEGRLLSSRYK